MKSPDESEALVNALLQQEPMLESEAFEAQQRRVRERLDRAAHRERIARRITLSIGTIGCFGIVALLGAGEGIVGDANDWPDTLKMAGAVTLLTLPILVVGLVVLYFFRPRRELRKSRDEAQRQVLRDLQHQINELKRQMPSSGNRGHDQRGFTLMELMGVIAILAILAGLLLPSLARAREKSLTTLCRGNLGQLGKALSLYTAEFRAYPGTRACPIPPGNAALPQYSGTNLDWVVWDRRLAPYFANREAILRCPVHHPTVFPGNAFTNYSYGYNAYGGGKGATPSNLGLGRVELPERPDVPSRMLEVAESSVRAPSDMLALADVDDLGGYTSTAVVAPSEPLALPAKRHAAGANAIFCDGHAEFGRQSQWIKLNGLIRQRWNNDHQPHPEMW